MIVVLLALAAAALAVENVRPVISKINRNGRQAEIRVINRLTPDSSRFLFLGGVNTTQTFNSASIQASTFINSGPTTTVISSVGSLTASDFFEIDAGEGGSATVRLNMTQTNTEACVFSVNHGERVTIVVRQGGNAPTFNTQSGSCSVGGGTCTQSTLSQPGTVTVSCTRIADNADSNSLDCNDHPVRFYNFLTPSCTNTRLERLDVAVPTGTELFLTSLVPVGESSANNPVIFNRAQRFALNNVNLWPHGESRFTDVILTDGAADVKQFNTSFLNVVNVAFRINAAESRLNNSFTYVITQGSSLVAKEVVHVQSSLGPQQSQGWIEVPGNQDYTLHLFEGQVTERDIFGDNSVTPIVAGTASSITSGSATVATNTMRIFRITTGSQDGQSAPSVSSVPLNGNNIPFDNTKFIMWNQVFQRQLQFASPSDDCCGILGERISFNGLPLSLTLNRNSDQIKTFDANSANLTCKTIGSPFISSTFAFSQTVTASDSCEVQGVFFNGRVAAKNVTASCGSGSGAGPCIQQVDSLNQINQFGLSEGFNLITLPVRLCACSTPVDTPSCDVCQATKFAEVLDSVASTRAAVLSASATSTSLSNTIKSQVTVLQAQITSTQKSLKKIGKTVDDIEDDLKKKN